MSGSQDFQPHVVVEVQGADRVTAAGARLRIGRAAECDIRIPGALFPTVGRLHAELRWNGQEWVLTNLHPNGTYLNGALLADPAVVSEGDVIQLSTGGPHLRVVSVSPREAASRTVLVPRPAAIRAGGAQPVPTASARAPLWVWAALTVSGMVLAGMLGAGVALLLSGNDDGSPKNAGTETGSLTDKAGQGVGPAPSNPQEARNPAASGAEQVVSSRSGPAPGVLDHAAQRSPSGALLEGRLVDRRRLLICTLTYERSYVFPHTAAWPVADRVLLVSAVAAAQLSNLVEQQLRPVLGVATLDQPGKQLATAQLDPWSATDDWIPLGRLRTREAYDPPYRLCPPTELPRPGDPVSVVLAPHSGDKLTRFTQIDVHVLSAVVLDARPASGGHVLILRSPRAQELNALLELSPAVFDQKGRLVGICSPIPQSRVADMRLAHSALRTAVPALTWTTSGSP